MSVRIRAILSAAFVLLSAGPAFAAERSGPPSWSADGFRIAFKRGGTIYTAHSDTVEVREVFKATAGEDVSPPVWAPTGAMILFTTVQMGSPLRRFKVIALDETTGDVMVLGHGESGAGTTVPERVAQWLAGGKQVAYVSRDGEEYVSKVTTVPSGEETVVARVRGLCAFSASEHAKHIAYGFASAADRGQVHVKDVGADGGDRMVWNMRPAQGFAGDGGSLRWSPDGRKLAALVVAPAAGTSTEGGLTQRLETWDLEGASPRRLFSGRSVAQMLWRSDGKALWVLSRPDEAVGEGAVLREIALDGSVREAADGDIVEIAGGRAPAGAAAYILRDRQTVRTLTGEHTTEARENTRLVGLYGAVTPVEITTHAVQPTWSPGGNKLAFRTRARTLGDVAVDAIGIAFLPTSRVEYLAFSFEERLWKADQFFRVHNHGDALRVYEELLAEVSNGPRTALEVRLWLARVMTKRAAEEEVDPLVTRMVAQPATCQEAAEAFGALAERARGIVFFGKVRDASEGIHPRAALQAQLAVFDLYWGSGLFDLGENMMITKIIPNYQEILTDVKERGTPVAYEPGVVTRLARLISFFPERLSTRYGDAVGLMTKIQEVYGKTETLRETRELKALVYSLRGEKGQALKVLIGLLSITEDPEERQRLWGDVLELELELEVP